MPRSKKPRPETQYEMMNKEITPYPQLDRGNPNPAEPTNRAEDLSLRKDPDKQIVIELEDINNAVLRYVSGEIRPTVVENGQQVTVPIQYAFGERWNQIQRQGALYDKKGVQLLPVIVITRNNITRNRALGNKVDGNKVHNYQAFQTQFTQKNQYDAFSLLNNRIPVKQWFLAPVPDYVIITYNCSIFTNKQYQLDQIIQAINFVADSYWGEENRFKFKVNIASYNNTVEYSQGKDRTVKCDFDLILNGYLLPKNSKRDKASLEKIQSKAQVVVKFSTEASSSVGGSPRDTFFLNTRATVIDTINNSPGQGIDMNLVNYINSISQKDAVSITGNTATFNAGFLLAPPGLPATSLLNFTFYVNGQLINSSSILSFTNGVTTSTLTVNTGSIGSGGLGFSFSPDWAITAIGKFN